MIALLQAYALLALAHVAAPVTLNVNLTNGVVLTGERSIKVTVVANNPVTQVEFYVGTDLRDNATSTPYTFKIDSLAENDGDLKLRFKAYTTEGEIGEKSFTVHIDNGLSKGADYHVQKALTFLANSDFVPAATEGRIALKADPKSNAARIVLTRAFLGARVFDKAQKYAEDAIAQDPNNTQALNLLASIGIQRALSAVAKEGGDRKDVLASELEALKSAVGYRRKVLDSALATVPAPTDSTFVKYTDQAIAAGRYRLVEQTLKPVFDQGNASSEVINRLAYVQMRLSRYKDALSTFDREGRLASDDPISNAIEAVCYAEEDNALASDQALLRAAKFAPENATVRTADAYIALKFARSTINARPALLLNYDELAGRESGLKLQARKALAAKLQSLQQDQAQRTETNYFAQALANKLEDYEKATKSFEDAVLVEPTNSDAYIEQGNRSIALSVRAKLDPVTVQHQYDAADTMFQAGLAASPSSAAALAGLSIVNSLEGRPDDAVKWGEAAIKANPDYAAGYAVLGTAYNISAKSKRTQADAIRKRNANIGLPGSERADNERQARVLEEAATNLVREAHDVGQKAAALDQRIQGYDLVSPAASWRYYYAGGRLPVIVPPGS